MEAKRLKILVLKKHFKSLNTINPSFTKNLFEKT